MFIRIFINAATKKKANNIYRNIKVDIETNIETEKIIKIEPYWKIVDVYVIESIIEFKEVLTENRLKKFLYSIADEWEFYGSPIDEALAASDESRESFKMKDVRMINIFFNVVE